MEILAQRGIDIMIRNKQGLNVFHLAVIKNFGQIIKMLLKSGYPLGVETNEGMTALQLAAYHGREDIIDLFIEHLREKEDQDLKNVVLNKVNPKKNYSTLAYAILQKEWTIAQKLIEFEARCYYCETDDSKDFSPIFMAVQYDDDENITKILELMCDHGASLTVKNSEGMTPIMFAAEMGFDKVVNYLSLRTRDLNEEDAYCNTILIHHLRNRKEKNDDFKMASNLIVRGADINYVNSNCFTALQIMVENRNIEAVKFLLSKNAERHLMDLDG
jgi:ankyrin repeat protein